MNFNDVLTDSITIRMPDGRTFHIHHALVERNMITFDDALVPVEEGAIAEYHLPNGLTQRFVVLDRGYRSAYIDSPAGYDMKVRRL